jgi:transposase
MSIASIPAKPNNRVLSDEEIKQLYRRYDKGGITYEELAKYHRVSKKTIQRYIRDRKVITDQLRPDPQTDWLSLDQIELTLARCLKKTDQCVRNLPMSSSVELPAALTTMRAMLMLRAHLKKYPVASENRPKPVDDEKIARLVGLIPLSKQDEFLTILKS